MSDLRTLLHQHATEPAEPLDVRALLARSRRRHLRNRLVAWLSSLAALGALAFPVEQALLPGGHSADVRTVQPPTVATPAPTPLPALPGGGTAHSSGSPANAPTERQSPGALAVGGSSRSGGATSPAQAASGPQGAASSDVPVAPVPLRAGRYLYDYSSSGANLDGSSTSGTSPLVVDSPTATSAGWLQHESFTYNLGGGYRATIQWWYLYAPSGMHQHRYVRDLTLNGAPYDHVDCPSDVLILPTGIRTGTSWQATKNCTDQLNGPSTETDSFTDAGPAQVLVGGRKVTAIEIAEQWGQGDTEDPYYDPRNGLAVEDDAQSNGGSTHMKARSLDPQ